MARVKAPPLGLAGFAYVFFFNDTATTEIYTLSLHDALPICSDDNDGLNDNGDDNESYTDRSEEHTSELQSRFGISYAVFCLKKKTRPQPRPPAPLHAGTASVLASHRLT